MVSRLFDGRATAQSILRLQTEYGAIPWFANGKLDPWDHIECAMALDAQGYADEARAAYRWLARIQRADGAWASTYLNGRPSEGTLDANFTAYLAAGCHHHFLHTNDIDFLVEMWPAIEAAIEFVLELQLPGGEIAWARDVDSKPWPGALVTSSSCIYLSLRSALAIASELGVPRPEWELAAVSLATAVARRRGAFINKDRFSMDWYYPVLSGIVTGSDAKACLGEGWEAFVIEGRGTRCVSDRPWVTAGETAELVIALCVVDERGRAAHLFDWLQHLRRDFGDYWTGTTWPDGRVWPREAPSWCGGAVILAAATLEDDTPTAQLFTETLPSALPADLSDAVVDPL